MSDRTGSLLDALGELIDPKDIADVGRLLEVASSRIDPRFVRDALVDMLGPDDERIAEWDRLVRRARS